MKIDRKKFSDVSIDSSKYSELYFDIDENTLVVKTSDGKFLVKQNDIPEGEINFKEIMREDDELSLTYPAQVGFLVDGTRLALPKNCADAYKLSDGTIYLSEEMESDTITHRGDYEWFICYFHEKHIPSDSFIDLSVNRIKWLIFKNCEFNNENYGIIANFYMSYSTDCKISFINSSTINITKFSSMFEECSDLTTIPQLNTSNGTDFSSMFYHCSSLTTVPQLNTSNGTNFSGMFSMCNRLTSIPQLNTINGTNFGEMLYHCNSLTTVPQLNTSNGTDFSYMFYHCDNLTSIPQLNTSNGTNFGGMFGECYSLTTIPQLNTSNGTDFSNMFSMCNRLTSIPQLNTSNGTDFSNMFNGSECLTTVPLLDLTSATYCEWMFKSCDSLKYLGGFKGLKAYLDLSYCEKLTHESLMNVINNLAESNATLTLGSTNLAKLTADEIAIATTKGWTLE